MMSLLEYDNVEIYYYQDEEEIITDLNLYMDMIHFSKDINQVMPVQARRPFTFHDISFIFICSPFF